MTNLLLDLRLVLRQLVRAPVFTASAILCLSVGLGATVAVFSIANAVLNRPLPVDDAQDVVLVSMIVDGAGRPFSAQQFFDTVESVQNVDLAIRTFLPISLSTGGAASMEQTELVSASYFTSVLKPRMILGRTFAREDDDASDRASIVIGERLWRRRFNSDSNVIGQRVRISAVDAVIIGVAPEDFTGAMRMVRPNAWIPLGLRKRLLPSSEASPTFGLVGRLRPGHTFAELQAQLRQVIPNIESIRSVQPNVSVELNRAAGVGMPPGVIGLVLSGMTFLAALAALVLTVAVANVSALLLIRGAHRDYELGVKKALGAGKSELIRAALIESLVLTISGVAVGTAIAWFVTGYVGLPEPADYIESIVNVRPDPNVVWFAAAVAILTGIASGVIPALRASACDPLQVIRSGRSGGRKAGQRFRPIYAFVIAQVAASTVLVFGTGLLVRAYARASDVTFDFDSQAIVAFTLDAAQTGYDEKMNRGYYDELLRRIREVPGVRNVALASGAPFRSGGETVDLQEIGGKALPVLKNVQLNVVSPEYFEMLGVHQVQLDDAIASPHSVIVNQSLFALIPAQQRTAVAAVIKDVVRRESAESREPTIYRVTRDEYRPQMTVLVQSAGAARSLMSPIRDVVRSLNPDVSIQNMHTLSEDLSTSLRFRRQLVSLFASLGIVAMLITGVGIYGVVAYVARIRRREFAIRAALGGAPKRIAWEVCRFATVLTVAGVVIGLPLAIALGVFLRSSLYGVSAWDLTTMLSVFAFCLVTALVASSRPAWTSVRTNISLLLRQD